MKTLKALVAVCVLMSVSACAVVSRSHDGTDGSTDVDTLWVPRDNKIEVGLDAANPASTSSAMAKEPMSSDIVSAGDRKETCSNISDSTRSVNLLDVLSKAQDFDADFQAAVTSRSISQRTLPIARSAQLPQFAHRYAGGYYNFKSDSSDAYTGQQLSLTLSQSIYDRANAIAVKQPKLTDSGVDTQLQAEHENLVIRVSTSYFNVLKAMAELDCRQSDVDATKQQLRVTENRFEVGEIAITDVVEARSQSDLAKASAITAKTDLDAALEALEVSTGMSLTNIAPLNQNIPIASPDPADVSAWVETALANNKSLLVARNQIDIAQQQLDQSRAGRLPVVSLTGYLSKWTVQTPEENATRHKRREEEN